MRTSVCCAIVAVCCGLPAAAQDQPSWSESPEGRFVAERGQNAVDYVVGLFAAHDLVIVGEIHEVADNCRFVADLVDDVYHRAGVRVLASEFVRRSQSEAMQTVVTAEEWDAVAAIDIMRHGANSIWGYREYLDIYQAVWKLNQSLPDGAEPMRLVGLDSEWDQLALLEETSESKRFKVRLEREQCMIASAEDALAAKGTKILAHVGYAHSVTGHGERFATVLKRRHGDRIFQVALHHNFPGPGDVSPFTQMMEGILSVGAAPLGITISGTPLAQLRRDDCMYFRMLGRDASLDEAAEGYVLLKPVAQLRPVTWIDGFIVDEQFERARELARRMRRLGPDEPCDDAAALNAILRRRLEERGAEPG